MRAIQKRGNLVGVGLGWGNIHIYLLGERDNRYINYHLRFQTPVFDEHILRLPSIIRVKEELVGTKTSEYKSEFVDELVFESAEHKAGNYAIRRGEKVLAFLQKILEDNGHECEAPFITTNNFYDNALGGFLKKRWKSYEENSKRLDSLDREWRNESFKREFVYPKTLNLATVYCANKEDITQPFLSLCKNLDNGNFEKNISEFIDTSLRNLHFLDAYSRFSIRYEPRQLVLGLPTADENSKPYSKQDLGYLTIYYGLEFCRKIISGEFEVKKGCEFKSGLLSKIEDGRELEDDDFDELTSLFRTPLIPTNPSKKFEHNLSKYNLAPQEGYVLDISDPKQFPEEMRYSSPDIKFPAAMLIQRPYPTSP